MGNRYTIYKIRREGLLLNQLGKPYRAYNHILRIIRLMGYRKNRSNSYSVAEEDIMAHNMRMESLAKLREIEKTRYIRKEEPPV